MHTRFFFRETYVLVFLPNGNCSRDWSTYKERCMFPILARADMSCLSALGSSVWWSDASLTTDVTSKHVAKEGNKQNVPVPLRVWCQQDTATRPEVKKQTCPPQKQLSRALLRTRVRLESHTGEAPGVFSW